MQSTATRLLTRFNQGDIKSVTVTVTDGANEWDAPTTSTDEVTLQGVSRGVSSEYVDGVNILSTDLEVTLQAGVIDLVVGSEVSLDGTPATVVGVNRIPPTGVAVVWKVFVRV